MGEHTSTPWFVCEDAPNEYWIGCCTAMWKELFGTLTPFKGRSLDEYLSENYRAV